VLYPENVLGFHANMSKPTYTIGNIIKKMMASYFPSWFVNEEEYFMLKKTLYEDFGERMLELGFQHIQATKPDTLGVGLGASPAGLAAWILGIFSRFTVKDSNSLEDGGLLSDQMTISKDEMLGDITLYWVTNTITSSVRFLKENYGHSEKHYFEVSGTPIYAVPTGIINFPNELRIHPRSVLQSRYAMLHEFFFDILCSTM